MCRILIIILACFFSIQAYSQDYYITFKGDTVTGFIKTSGNYAIKYSSTEKGPWTKLSSKEVKIYYLAKKGDKKMSVQLPIIDPLFEDPQFKEIVEEGTINLVVERYSTRSVLMPPTTGATMVNHSSGEFLYIQKDPDKQAWLFERKFFGAKDNGTEKARKHFEELIADKPILLKRFQQETRISFDEIRKYVRDYNAAQ